MVVLLLSHPAHSVFSHGYMCTHDHDLCTSQAMDRTERSPHLQFHMHVSSILTRLCCGKPSCVVPSVPLPLPPTTTTYPPSGPHPTGPQPWPSPPVGSSTSGPCKVDRFFFSVFWPLTSPPPPLWSPINEIPQQQESKIKQVFPHFLKTGQTYCVFLFLSFSLCVLFFRISVAGRGQSRLRTHWHAFLSLLRSTFLLFFLFRPVGNFSDRKVIGHKCSAVALKTPWCSTMCNVEPAPVLFKLSPTASNAAHQREFFMSRDVARAASSAGSAASGGFSLDQDLPGRSNMVLPLGGSLGTCHSGRAALSQSCHFAEPQWRVPPPTSSSPCAMRTWSTSAWRKRRACSAGMSR